MTPTHEQSSAVSLFGLGESLAVEAGAGTGKTSTLVLMARSTARRGQYVAFNRAIVEEAERRFPRQCATRTMHSLAYRAEGQRYRHRLNAPRMKSAQIGRILDIPPFVVPFGQQSKTLASSYLGSLAMRAVHLFCMSADESPSERHIPYVAGIDLPDGERRTYEHNDRLRRVLRPYLARVWADLTNPDGVLPFRHDVYLKMWSLNDPRITAEYLVVDEAQDLDPVQAVICERQEGRLQIVYVGDGSQSIYEWRGAVNAFDRLGHLMTLQLTESFRFGDEIATVANVILNQLHAPLRLTGQSSIPSRVRPVEEPNAVLTRTNALAVKTVLEEQLRGRNAYLLGGATDIYAFLRGVEELRAHGSTTNRDLACFTSWEELTEYVRADPQGDELALMVDLVEEHGVDELKAALAKMPASEAEADVVVSTAHKAKGREWDAVRLGADFRYRGDGGELPPEEWRLLYVACTRAKLALDVTRSRPMRDLLGLDQERGAA